MRWAWDVVVAHDGPMGLFATISRRSSSPHQWTQLWDVLKPLGGRTTPDAVARWSRWARELPAETLTTAAGQLAGAYELLDTEKHGRALAVEPFAGVERPFARRRFLRVLDRVILSGPDAVVRVSGSPELVRGYDTVHLLDPEAVLLDPDRAPAFVNLSALLDDVRVLRGTAAPTVADLRGAAAAEAARTLTQMDFAHVASTWTTSRRWPALRSAKGPVQLRFAMEDPEIAWLAVEATDLCDDEAEDADPTHVHDDCWVAAADAAAVEIFRALGGAAGAQHDLSHRHVWVEILAAEDATLGAGAPEVDGNLSMVMVELPLSEHELAVVDQQARVALLVRRTAERLSRVALPWSGHSREALVALASGARG